MEPVIKKYLPWLRVFENYPLEGHSTDLIKRYEMDLIQFRKFLNSKRYTYVVKCRIELVYGRLYATHHKFKKIDALYARGTEADLPSNPAGHADLPDSLGQSVE